MSNFLSIQDQFKNAWWIFSYHEESTHFINLDHETSSQLIDYISTFLSQTYNDREFSDAYANNTFNNAQRKQFSSIHSLEDLQLSSSSQKSSLLSSSLISQLSFFCILKNFWSQSSYLNDTSNHIEKSFLYVNVKQFHQILKRRVVIYVWIHKSYIHESRHRHATRRSREFEGKILTKDELKKKEKRLKMILQINFKDLKQRLNWT